MGAKKKPKKKPVKKQACRPPHRPAPPTPVTTLRPIPDPHAHTLSAPPRSQAKAQSDDSELFYHEGTKGFTGDPNAFVYKIGLSS